MEILRLENITKIYGKGDNKTCALNGINLSIEKGESVSVLGTSGSGKSTLLNMMGGVDVPTEGNIYVEGQNITKLKDNELALYRRRKVGFVFQAYHLLPVLSVRENIEMPVLLDHRKPDKEYIDYLLEMLHIKDHKDKMPGQLSGGQQQRCAIARALANRPVLLLADEPTGALDQRNGEEVMSLLTKSVKELNQTLVLITHNLNLARETERLVHIEDGKIVS